MKVSKQIQLAFSEHSKANSKRLKLQADIFQWVEKQGIDVTDEGFMNAIGVRISEDEFISFDEFIEDIKRYKNGENVGYG